MSKIEIGKIDKNLIIAFLLGMITISIILV